MMITMKPDFLFSMPSDSIRLLALMLRQVFGQLNEVCPYGDDNKKTVANERSPGANLCLSL